MQARNPRYAKVPTKLNTGPNMRKVLAQYENTSGPNARPKQQHEFYTKLKPLTLAKLLEPAMAEEESVYKLVNEDACSMVSSIVPSDAGTDVRERGANLLLLDVRSFDRYQDCHLFGARHYDPVQLTKATNNFPRELYYYRGPMGGDKMIVLYDHDGKGVQVSLSLSLGLSLSLAVTLTRTLSFTRALTGAGHREHLRREGHGEHLRALGRSPRRRVQVRARGRGRGRGLG